MRSRQVAHWHCRIGRIRPKNGGAVVRVFDTHAERSQTLAEIRLAALPSMVEADFPEGISCYAMVAWSDQGMSKCYYSINALGPIPVRLVPDFCRARLLEDVILDRSARDIANDVIDERFS